MQKKLQQNEEKKSKIEMSLRLISLIDQTIHVTFVFSLKSVSRVLLCVKKRKSLDFPSL